jgi:hypothetical protein
MNERIKLLAEQAGFSTWVLNPSKETMSDTPELLEKFAELIVRECVQVVNAADDSCEDYYGTIIKEHFGVEQ